MQAKTHRTIHEVLVAVALFAAMAAPLLLLWLSR